MSRKALIGPGILVVLVGVAFTIFATTLVVGGLESRQVGRNIEAEICREGYESVGYILSRNSSDSLLCFKVER